MKALKLNQLIFSGEKDEIVELEPYFETILTFKSNQEILTFSFLKPEIIFLNCDENRDNCIKIIKKIRKQNRKSVIVIMSKEKNINIFLSVLHLHLSGYLQKPFKKNDIKKLLINIKEDLAPFTSDEKIYLKEGYSFNTKQFTLFDEQYKIIKLTKYEKKLMQILSNEKNSYISSESIEYDIWEEQSLEQDCNKRLKHLIYCLRKKLPKESIINSYNLGYKLTVPS